MDWSLERRRKKMSGKTHSWMQVSNDGKMVEPSNSFGECMLRRPHRQEKLFVNKIEKEKTENSSLLFCFRLMTFSGQLAVAPWNEHMLWMFPFEKVEKFQFRKILIGSVESRICFRSRRQSGFDVSLESHSMHLLPCFALQITMLSHECSQFATKNISDLFMFCHRSSTMSARSRVQSDHGYVYSIKIKRRAKLPQKQLRILGQS